MEINFTLTENDFLQQQLYLASKSKLIKKQKKLARVFVTLILLLIGFLFYLNKCLVEACYFTSAGIVCFFIFPIYLKHYYQRLFKKYVNENLKERVGIASSIIFKEDLFETTSENIGKAELNFSSFENIIEIADYFFITFKASGNLMIPKDKIENVENLRNKLITITEKQQIDFLSELDWKWK